MASEPSSELHIGEILERVVGAGIDFVLIGGIAGLAHGSAYPTFDIDVAYSRDRANLERLARVLKELDVTLRDAPAQLPVDLDAAALDRSPMLTLETTYGPLDLIADPAGVPSYEALRDAAWLAEIEGVEVRVASLDHLIAMKRAAGRPKDALMAAEYTALANEIARAKKGPARD